MFVLVITLSFKLMEQGNIPQHFINDTMKLIHTLTKKKNIMGFSNFWPLAKQREQSCAVKCRVIQDNMHLMHLNTEKVDDHATLIIFTKSKVLIVSAIISWELPCTQLDSNYSFNSGFSCCMQFLEI